MSARPRPNAAAQPEAEPGLAAALARIRAKAEAHERGRGHPLGPAVFPAPPAAAEPEEGLAAHFIPLTDEQLGQVRRALKESIAESSRRTRRPAHPSRPPRVIL